MKGLKANTLTFPAWILVLYSVIVGVTIEIGFGIPAFLLSEPENGDCYTAHPDSLVNNQNTLFIVQNTILCLQFPLTGWFSDIVIGRKKAITVSLWLCWFGSVLQCISLCVYYGCCGLPVNVAKYGISSVALICISLGGAGLFTNILPYGLDQLFEKPHSHSLAFTYWSVWGVFCGFTFGFMGFVENIVHLSEVIQISTLATVIITSFAVCLHLFIIDQFETINFRNKNPYKMVLSVLKYAWLHKIPERRSSLTFWKNDYPSRIDLCQTEYGGPFSKNDINDVKIFFKLIILFLSLFGLYISYYHTFIGALSYINNYDGAVTSLNGFGSFVLWQLFDSSITLIVPILMFIVIPIFPKLQYYIQSPMIGMLICHIFQIISLSVMLILEYFHGKGYKISFAYFGFSLFFSGLVDAFSFVFGLEVVCSQAPSSMKGMLTGYYWFIRTFFSDIGAVFAYISVGKWSNCIILLIQLLICICGLVVFMVISRWYKINRKDFYDLHIHVEDVYYKSILQAEAQTSKTIL